MPRICLSRAKFVSHLIGTPHEYYDRMIRQCVVGSKSYIDLVLEGFVFRLSVYGDPPEWSTENHVSHVRIVRWEKSDDSLVWASDGLLSWKDACDQSRAALNIEIVRNVLNR